jgi:hypothetical protein
METHVECICPTHSDGQTAIDHNERCDGSCRDTHAYWNSSLPLEGAMRVIGSIGGREVRTELPIGQFPIGHLKEMFGDDTGPATDEFVSLFIVELELRGFEIRRHHALAGGE